MSRRTKRWEMIAAVLQDFFRRHWQRALIIRDYLRLSEEALHLLIAGLIGVLGGLTNWTYYLFNQSGQLLVFGETGDLLSIAQKMPYWLRVVVPTVGGLVAGLVLVWGSRLIGSPGLTNLLEVVVAGDGRLPSRPAVVNAASSLVSITTGASIGREGLIIQLAATVASKLGQVLKWPPYRLRLLVACGAAAGLAAGCNAPIAGAVFAAQIVLGNFSMSMFAPLVVASVIASVISRGFFGTQQWYKVPAFPEFTQLSELPWFLVLGLLSGIVGAFFLKSLRWAHGMFDESRIPLYGRLAIGGLMVGLIAVIYPHVLGNGYTATTQILSPESHPNVQFIVGLFAAKFFATVITVGCGTVGGVFTPTLFLGASLGSLLGVLLHLPNIGTELPTGAFALVGMGSVLAATTHSPLLAILMIFELSLSYSVMPPLMLSCVIASMVARRLHKESVYTEPLRRKGVELERESPQVGAATQLAVGDVMRQRVPPVLDNTRFQEIANRFLTSTFNYLPVVDAQDRLLGMVALHDLKEWLSAGQELSSVIAYDVMRPVPACLTPNQRISDVLPILLASEMRNIPVVNNLTEYKLIGTVARGEALGMISEAISLRSGP